MEIALDTCAVQARNMVRIANDELTKVVLMRMDESPVFTAIMERHFNLKANGDTAGGWLTDNVVNKPFAFGDVFKHDRRWALEQIRQKMLSLSFHLNTGIYIIALENRARTVLGGYAVAAGTKKDHVQGYVSPWDNLDGVHLCGFRNGEIHIDFHRIVNLSLNSGARLIVHEAAHKFLSVKDTYYACETNYPPTLRECLDANADSFACTAASLALGRVVMATAASRDEAQCPGGAL
jgi:hypothetical protein